jgi:preprotein translocase subunit SecD
MARRRPQGYLSLIFIVVLAIAALGYTFLVGNKPLLGLDLQGGVSVVLKPTTEASDEQLSQAIEIMRKRINDSGLAEPEITKRGQTILVEIPGVKEPERAIEIVGTTAEVRFRPVLATLAPEGAVEQQPSPVDPNATVPETAPADPNATVPETAPADPNATAPETVPADPATSTTPGSDTSIAPAPGTQEQGMALSLGENAVGRYQTPPTTVSDIPPASDAPTSSDAPPASDPTTTDTLDPQQQQLLQQQLQQQAGQQGGASAATANCPGVTTTAAEDKPENTVLLPYIQDGQEVYRLCLGPAALTGTSLSGASASLNQNGQWQVLPTFKGGADGIDKFNALASECYAGAPTCPPQTGQERGQAAITIDGRVISAPEIQTPSFQADQVQISGSFTEKEAKDLALVLKYGSLPVEFAVQASEQVSASLGRDALQAGLVAGAVGFVLVAIYMLAWYRILGLLALFKLLVEGALLWTIIAHLGSNEGLALTLAGIMGIIVSIGVSLDSNVVYYEHLREDVVAGRTVRSAVDKSFVAAYSTIVKADVASILGAAVLWRLAVGPVKGFAFYLGVSTLIDLISSYFLMRPLVGSATRSKLAQRRPSLFGLPAAGGAASARSDATKATASAAEPNEPVEVSS